MGSLNFMLGLIIVIVVLFILINIIIIIYNDFGNNMDGEKILIYDTKIGNKLLKIPGSEIRQSVDGQYGTEFTYSFWIYINDWSTRQGEWKHVFHKGNNLAMPLQAPGVWLYPNENTMAINMNTYHSVKESCDIGNIPVRKWVHITIVVIDKNIDVYVNGELKKRNVLKGIPKQNFDDLYINAWQGFDGFLSKFRYFNYAVPYWKIEQIVSSGPSDAPCSETGEKPPYLASNYWQTTGFPNAVGPI